MSKDNSSMEPIAFSKPISVLILYYVGTNEDDRDTLEAVKGIGESLARRKHNVRKVAVTQKNWRNAVKIPADVVFNLVEDDTWNLYINVGKRLEKMGRAQVGHDIKCFRYATRKTWIKRRLKRLGVSTPNSKIYSRSAKSVNLDGLRFPLIVKPSEQHAAIGVSQASVVVIGDALEKQVQYVRAQYPGDVIVEEYIQGREIHVTLLGNGRNVSVLPLCEVGFGGKFSYNWSVYTYKAKWDKKSWEYRDTRVRAPVKMTLKLERRIRLLATRVYKAFGCRDIARLDIRVDENGRPYLIDLNINPSLNYYDSEDATIASAYALKWTYDQFLETIVATTYQRIYGKMP